MQGLCQGRNVTQSPGLTSTIKDHPSSLPVLQIFPEIRVQDRQLRETSLEECCDRKFMSVTEMRDGKGKAFWKVADPGGLGVLSTLRTKVTKPWGQERDVG